MLPKRMSDKDVIKIELGLPKPTKPINAVRFLRENRRLRFLLLSLFFIILFIGGREGAQAARSMDLVREAEELYEAGMYW